MCLVPLKARGACWVPWNRVYTDTVLSCYVGTRNRTQGFC